MMHAVNTFLKSINFTNFLCRCENNILINSFARMLMLRIYLMLTVSFWTFWHNQWRCISTWRNLMLKKVSRAVKARIVCRLSHLMYINDVWKAITLKKRFYHILMLTVMNIASSFASIELIIIVFCLLAFQSIISSKSLKQYSCKL